MCHYISSSIHLLALILRCRQKFYHIHFLSHHKKPLIQFSKARWSAKRVSGVRWGEDWGKLNKETPVPFKTANNTRLKQSSIKRNLHSTKRVLCITVPDLSFALTKAYTTLNESYFLLILNHLVYQRRTTHNFWISRANNVLRTTRALRTAIKDEILAQVTADAQIQDD